MKRGVAFFAILLVSASVFAADWLSSGDWEKAKDKSKKTGRPIAVLYHGNAGSCPIHDRQVDGWVHSTIFDNYICIKVNSDQPHGFLSEVRHNAAGKSGKFIPMVFLISYDEKVLDVLNSDTTMAASKAATESALKKCGPFPSLEKGTMMWKKLEEARKLIDEPGKVGNAMAIYKDLQAVAKVNAKLAIISEVKADTEKINQKGKQLIEQAKQMVADGKPQDALVFLRQLATAFQGYDVAKEIAEAGKQISEEAKKAEVPPQEPVPEPIED